MAISGQATPVKDQLGGTAEIWIKIEFSKGNYAHFTEIFAFEESSKYLLPELHQIRQCPYIV